MKEISIRHGSRMANRMLQYLTARSIADRYKGCEITGYNIPEWSLTGASSSGGNRRWPRLDIQTFDHDWLFDRIDDGTISHLRLKSVTSDINLLPTRAKANKIFDAGDQDYVKTTAKDLVIHVRLGDIMQPGRHPAYGPLPIAWYAELVKTQKLRPVFVGELADDPYSNALRAAFPKATFIEGGSVLHDFETIRNAHNVAVGVSTFSWMAAWLGAKKRVYYPLLGVLNPRQMPATGLTPIKDSRYKFFEFPVRRWGATPEDIEAVISGPSEGRPITKKALQSMLDDARKAHAPAVEEWRARLSEAQTKLAA